MSDLARPGEGAQVRTLARTFLARFFDNELTAGSRDLRHSFLWLVAALATPGLALPNGAMVRWERTALMHAPEGGVAYLGMSLAVDLVFSLGMTMVTVGLLAAIVWHSLLLDRRDVLVLGGFPIRPRTLIAAKFAALAAFFGIVSLGMHAGSAFFYGLHLGGQMGFFTAVRLAIVHAIVATAAGLFTFLAVVAAQGLLLVVAGRHGFERLTPLLQVALVAAVVCLFIALPIAAASVLGPLYGLGAERQGWVLWLPPVWFAGLYQRLRGQEFPVVQLLASRAVIALVVVAGTALVTYPIAYRRILAEALIGSTMTRRPRLRRWSLAAHQTLPAGSIASATTQFLFAVLGRIGLHRLILAMAIGGALALIVPIVGANLGAAPAWPTPGLLAIPAVLMIFLVCGLRIAVAIPAELPAAWVFHLTTDRTRPQHRAAVRGTLWTIGVVMPVIVAMPAYAIVWSGGVAIAHAIVMLALGTALVELALIGVEGMPCARAYEPGRAQLQSRWPLFALGLMLLLIEIPLAEATLLRTGGALAVWPMVALFVLAALAIRWAVDRTRVLPPDVDSATPQAADLGLH